MGARRHFCNEGGGASHKRPCIKRKKPLTWRKSTSLERTPRPHMKNRQLMPLPLQAPMYRSHIGLLPRLIFRHTYHTQHTAALTYDTTAAKEPHQDENASSCYHHVRHHVDDVLIIDLLQDVDVPFYKRVQSCPQRYACQSTSR